MTDRWPYLLPNLTISHTEAHQISLNVAEYHKSCHKNMKPFGCLFSQSSRKNINLFKTEMEEHETALCRHTHI